MMADSHRQTNESSSILVASNGKLISFLLFLPTCILSFLFSLHGISLALVLLSSASLTVHSGTLIRQHQYITAALPVHLVVRVVRVALFETRSLVKLLHCVCVLV